MMLVGTCPCLSACISSPRNDLQPRGSRFACRDQTYSWLYLGCSLHSDQAGKAPTQMLMRVISGVFRLARVCSSSIVLGVPMSRTQAMALDRHNSYRKFWKASTLPLLSWLLLRARLNTSLVKTSGLPPSSTYCSSSTGTSTATVSRSACSLPSSSMYWFL